MLYQRFLKVIEKGKNLKPSFPNICPSCANETQKQAVELSFVMQMYVKIKIFKK